MTLKRHDGSLFTYDDSFSFPKPDFIVTGQYALPGSNNYDVRVYTDIKTGHNTQSPDPLYDHPTIYWSIPHIIAQGFHYPSTSLNPDHLARKKDGHTEVYQLDNYYELLDNVDWTIARPGHSAVVPVFYPNDGRPPKALTFYTAPNPFGEQLG